MCRVSSFLHYMLHLFVLELYSLNLVKLEILECNVLLLYHVIKKQSLIVNQYTFNTVTYSVVQNCLHNPPLMPIKFEQSSALKEGTKRLSLYVHLPTPCPSLIGKKCTLPGRQSWPPAFQEIQACIRHNF